MVLLHVNCGSIEQGLPTDEGVDQVWGDIHQGLHRPGKQTPQSDRLFPVNGAGRPLGFDVTAELGQNFAEGRVGIANTSVGRALAGRNHQFGCVFLGKPGKFLYQDGFTIAGLAAEVSDLQRFFQGQKWDKRRKRFRPKNLRDVEDTVAKIAGLWWPRKDSSDFQGEERRMSKKGNRFLRYYLVGEADKLRQYQPEYQGYHQRKYQETKKHQHKRALALTARKSVGLFVGLLHRNEPYRPQKV